MNSSHLFLIAIPGILAAGLSWPSWAAALVDPTKPPNFQAVAPVPVELPKEVINYRLNAVKISADSRWAIINGERVSEGGKIGQAQVVQIQPGKVLINYNGQQVTLSLLAHDVKNPPLPGEHQSMKP